MKYRFLQPLNNKGQTVALAQEILIVAIFLSIGAIILGYTFGSFDHSDLSTDASTAINDTEDTVWSSWGLLRVVLIVLAAVVVLSAIFWLRGR